MNPHNIYLHGEIRKKYMYFSDEKKKKLSKQFPYVMRYTSMQLKKGTFPDTKRKRKQTKPNKRKLNKHTKSTKISSLFPKRGNQNAKRTEITQEQCNS